MNISKTNPNYSSITYDDIKVHKKLNDKQLDNEFKKLKKFNTDKNTRSFVGNKIIYHYFLENMINTKRDVKNYKTLKEIFEDDFEKKKFIDLTIKLNRRKKLDYIEPVDIYEAHRLCKGSINTFKSSTVNFLINKFHGTKMLDFSAGWGGRLLGAWSAGCEYTGIDTNINLKEGYDQIIQKTDSKMIWKSCLDVDLSKIDFDFVLTSPPYINLEIYENMTLFESKENYYKNFLITMINRCLKNIKNNGKVCINISNYMYDDYLKYGGKPCIEKIDLLQQLGGKPNKEIVYVFQ